MGQQQPPQGNVQQHSTDYAPYPTPVSQEEYPNATPGVPAGQTWGTQVMGSPASPSSHPDNSAAATRGFGPGPYNSSGGFQSTPGSGSYPQQTFPGAGSGASNPSGYVNNPAPQGKDAFAKISSAFKGVAAQGGKAATNISKYFSSGQSVADTVVGRTSLGLKLLSEGGAFNVFRNTFGATPNEELIKTYACYLSTSNGPVAGTLYLSNLKLAFCSDRPLTYNPTPAQQAMSHYKVILPLDRVKSVNPSANQNKPDEKYIQVDMLDSHEFWFMGFVNYDKAVKNLREVVAKFRPAGGSQGSEYGQGAGQPPQGYQPVQGPQGYQQTSGPPSQAYPPNASGGSQQQPPYPQQAGLYSQGSGGPYPSQGGSGSYPPQSGGSGSYPPQGSQYPSF